MKTTKGYLRSLRTFDTTCQGHVFTLGGNAASHENNLLIKQALRASLSILPSVVSDRELHQRISIFLIAVKREDFLDLLATNERVYRILIQDWTTFSDFKGLLSDCELQFLAPVLGLIRHMMDQRDYRTLKQVNTWLRFLSKLSFEMDSLEKNALEDYLQNLKRIKELDLEANPHVDGIARIIRSWLNSLSIGPCLPVRHGPGSVAEGPLSKFEKYKALAMDTRLKLCLQCGDYGDDLRCYFPLGYLPDLNRTSRVVFVPKNAKKLRTICSEPSSLQYVQQGVMRVLYKYIAKHPYLSRHIFLRDATRNHDLACCGSVFGTFCTIDLSAASDSVSMSLVRRLFRGTPLYKWMLGTRSDRTLLPDGTTVDLSIFAPMGSALCFPTECLIFAAVIEYVTRLRHHRHITDKQWLVYGDDMIVNPVIVGEVMDVLLSLGFKVNHDKSFVAGPFRESCGKEFYKGVEVTPLYYRISAVAESLSPSQYDSYCSTINLSGERGFPFLRSYLIDELRCQSVKIRGKLRSIKTLCPFFVDTTSASPQVFSPEPTNFHLEKVWNVADRKWDLWFYKHLGLRPRAVEKVPVEFEDCILYHEYLSERCWSPNGESDDPTPYRLAKRDHAFCMVWAPSYSDGGHPQVLTQHS